MESENTAKAIAVSKINVKTLAWFTSLILVASVLPHFVHNQLITGPIVNATLFLGAVTLSSGLATLVGLVPSVAALSSGLLPIVLAPMVPFIMISNAVLVLVFAFFRKNNFWLAAVIASLLKYFFLYATSFVVTNMILQKPVAAKAAATMMTWPQLVTALVGAIIAYGILKVVKTEEI